MANLLGQNIGTNYKGILNLNTLNGNLTSTLQAVTDGDGNASPLTLSTNEVGISRTIALSAGSSNVRLINETYTINNSGAQTGTATGIFLNATETALNGMGHNLMDLQIGGVSRFRVDAVANNIQTSYNITAAVFLGNAISVSSSGGVKVGSSRIRSDADGNLTLLNDAANSFGLLKFGGTTNAFPAIKRNGAAIDFRLADDSAFCNIQANNATLNRVLIDLAGVAFQGATNTNLTPSSNGWTLGVNAATNSFHFGRTGSFDTRQATAMVQIDSTTQGFLPPRMTTTQKNAITTPATGLVLYDTTLNKLCVYTGSAWETITSV